MRIELLIAQTILQGFDAQYGRFLEVTSGAQQRFENADWSAVQAAMKQRIHLYDHHVGLVVAQLKCITGQRFYDAAFLIRIKECYSGLLPDYPRAEIAESFFNSVYCRIFKHRDLTADKLFIFSEQSSRRQQHCARPLSRLYPVQGNFFATLVKVLDDLPVRLPWEDANRDVDYIATALKQRFPAEWLADADIEIATEIFYRNKAAWIIGKIRCASQVSPLLLPVHLSHQNELFVDACLTESNDASIVFGFARSYFMVYAPQPGALVEWLREILPAKTTAELYSAIGCQKHAKTECYREHLHFMAQTDESFIIAPGVKGMVMLVFTLAGSDRVFKVIKDNFAPQKEVTEAQVKACYQLVKEHDRVGRMADTQEFEHFVLPKKNISPELMAELQREVPAKIEDLGDSIALRHLYIERRMTPLNLYLEQASDTQLHDVIEEYGNAIKQLAAANIFPGDMLFKNFGVTRHGRVVFYDYDEICYMTEVNFRDIPAPRYPEDELASEPWYSIAPGDVFPEEFRHFLCSDKRLGQIFETLHDDLFSAGYWRGLQQRIREGHVEDVFAYRRSRRFSQR
ncbi:bifunctional isocitrate dehydrogenase kinase/phosphatase [Rahnella aceris]|jgi:isocitrate dehydrogenase kinase/phosphatase|uniref:bifunctional isocitrate dehydrogenase kinase/phosphatase n=1 Tax=Rahnella sp. (strain Y9602) TaxID=2703885 RepID=UPI001C27C35D|nr:bifunctional isocitrate dehydrogenase kinase/phosphatase [Rahnella aceris]MBU9839239.1 bifunctional isocitrate dehydrogenase kinase/phosphatase [Rahnella aceris]